MITSQGFNTFSKIILINVFLVIIAGGVVRMTQSGMGCPDWPKCFGQWIPPTEESQLPANYKEIYAFKYVDTSFNVYHTWIEYVNRLLGALLGVLLFVQFIWSLRYWKVNRKIVFFCFALLLLTGFQGWLGSKVVEANLEVAKITTHMLVALIIAGLAYHIIYLTKKEIPGVRVKAKSLVVGTLILLATQIILGTAVREQIDHISIKMNFLSREKWIEQLDNLFLVHRSFSIIVAASCLYLYIKFKKFSEIRGLLNFVMLIVILIITVGVLMNYLAIPAWAQPMHLLLSSILAVLLYSIFLKSAWKTKS